MLVSVRVRVLGVGRERERKRERGGRESERADNCRENLWTEIQLKGPQRQKQTQEQNKKEWASSTGLC